MGTAATRPQQFDPADIPMNSVVAVIARHGLGSERIIKDILYQKRGQFGGGYISGHIDYLGTEISDVFDEDEVKCLITEHDRKGELTGFICAILENSAPSDFNISGLSAFMRRKRHPSFIIMGLQYPSISPRGVDYVVLARDMNPIHLKELFDHYGWMFSSFEEFYNIFDEYTKDYNCMVIHLSADDGHNGIYQCQFQPRDNFTLIERC
jgi:hypothetical protein